VYEIFIDDVAGKIIKMMILSLNLLPRPWKTMMRTTMSLNKITLNRRETLKLKALLHFWDLILSDNRLLHQVNNLLNASKTKKDLA